MNFSGTTSLASSPAHKIVFLGASGAGKTSVVDRIVHGKFDPNQSVINSLTKATVILDTLRKNVIHAGKIRKLLFWDTAGQ